jgi:hypothetical protein
MDTAGKVLAGGTAAIAPLSVMCPGREIARAVMKDLFSGLVKTHPACKWQRASRNVNRKSKFLSLTHVRKT